jgi:hypothetical protein
MQKEKIMVEETNQETPEATVAEADAPEQKASETEQGLLPEDNKPEDKGNAPIPEGLDEEIFDAETRTLKEAAVVERLKQKEEDIAKWKKQANDMRRKLSKGVEAPEKVEAYAENFVPDERYEFIMDDNETTEGKHIHDVLTSLDKFAFDHGLSVETAKDLKNMYMKYAEDVQIIDGRSEEEKEQARAEYIAQQKKLLGDNAVQIIKENKRFAEDYGMWSDDEKKWLLGEMNKSAVANSVVQKVRKLFGQNTSEDIPVRGVSVSGLADDQTLADEYYKDTTSDARRMEILQMRIDAGRSGGLPPPR